MEEGQRWRETENPKQAPGHELSTQSPTQGSNSKTARPRPEPKSDAQLTEPPRRSLILFFYVYSSLKDRERQSTSGGGAAREGGGQRI